MVAPDNTILLTGFPSSLLARRLLAKMLDAEPDSRICCPVSEPLLDRANSLLAELEETERQRVKVFPGDPSHIDFGLSGRSFLQLAQDVDVIWHCAAITQAGADRHLAERVNVGGTGELLELAEAASHLKQLVFWSTAQVSGTQQGTVLEDELVPPPDFPTVVEETRFRAERLVRRAMERIPTTILRPGTIVGDATTGEIDRFDGPYLLIRLVLGSPVDLHLPLPNRGDVPLNMVPICYVVDAGFAIANDPRSLGRTFHLVDPNPPTARQVLQWVADKASRPITIGDVSTALATALLRTPGLKRFPQIPRAFLEQLAAETRYDTRNTTELLSNTELSCPPVHTYLDALIDYLKARQPSTS